MKHMKTYESYRNSRRITEKSISEITESPVNEEFFAAIGRWFSNMFKKIGETIRKTKGGQQVETIYSKYLGLMKGEFMKTAGVDLNIMAADKQAELDKAEAAKKPAVAGAPVAGVPAAGAPEVAQKESFLIRESDEANSKMTVDKLKEKKAVLELIVKKYKEIALKEMDAVLKSLGGSAKNPQLEVIINSKKDQFDMDFLSAKISYLEKSGDKTLVVDLTKQRDLISKKIEKAYKDIDTLKPTEYKAGDSIVHLLKGKTKDDWNKLTDEEKKKPTEGKAKEIVGVHNIEKIEGDKYTLLDKDGQATIVKTTMDIIGKPKVANFDFKEGDKVVYKRDGFKQEVWDKMTPEEKKNPDDAKQEEIKIGIKK